MRKISFILLLTLSSLILIAQDIKVISFKEFQTLTERNDDTTYVYNFWATWCKECVAELPNFENLNTKYSSKKIKVVLISLDFKRELDTRLKPYVANHNIQSDVYLLNEPDYNSWIDKVDPSWSGAIPITLVINHQKKIRQFYEKSFTFAELEEVIKPFINN